LGEREDGTGGGDGGQTAEEQAVKQHLDVVMECQVNVFLSLFPHQRCVKP